MTKGFNRVSHYGDSADYIGYGYLISNTGSFGTIRWSIFKMEDCKEWSNGYFDTFDIKEIAHFDYLNQAKDYAKANAR